MNAQQFQKLPEEFYHHGALYVARNLLGKQLVKREEGIFLAGKIVEVEAYTDKNDEASHSYKGVTNRNKTMFALGGKLYVYFVYGNHFCCNVVCDKEGVGAAVLIRAIEPLNGIEVMAQRRFKKKDMTEKEFLNLTNGPGKICQAYNISAKENGIDLCGGDIFLADGDKVPKKQILQSSRIGIKKSTELQWRFYLNDNSFVLGE